MRQKSTNELSWVTIVQGSPTQIQIEPLDIPEGYYELILESFDDTGTQKATLKEDSVLVQVLPPVFIRDIPVPEIVYIHKLTNKTITI